MVGLVSVAWCFSLVSLYLAFALGLSTDWHIRRPEGWPG
jgi:hypothetical protein